MAADDDKEDRAFFAVPADKTMELGDRRFVELTNLVLDLLMLNMHTSAALNMLVKSPALEKTPGIEFVREEARHLDKRLNSALDALQSKRGFDG